LSRREQRGYLKLFDRFNRLRHQSEETLATDSDVLVVVIGSINREVVRARAHAVHCKLARGTDAWANTWTSHAALCLGRRRDTWKQERQLIERTRQRRTSSR